MKAIYAIILMAILLLPACSLTGNVVKEVPKNPVAEPITTSVNVTDLGDDSSNSSIFFGDNTNTVVRNTTESAQELYPPARRIFRNSGGSSGRRSSDDSDDDEVTTPPEPVVEQPPEPDSPYELINAIRRSGRTVSAHPPPQIPTLN
jgi:hypothetical protein